jgi:hypothetical protein
MLQQGNWKSERLQAGGLCENPTAGVALRHLLYLDYYYFYIEKFRMRGYD